MVYIFNGINLYIIYIFITFSLGQFIKNPIKIDDDSKFNDYIINLESNNKQFTTSNGKTISIIKDDTEIIYNSQSFYLSPNFYLCKDESGYYFLFANFNYYSKNPNNKNNIIESLNLISTLPHNVKYNGFIKEKEYNHYDPISKINKNEIIIYGKQEEYLFFKYNKEGNTYKLNINNIGENISCKLVRSSRYVCAYFLNDILEVSTIMLKYISSNNKELEIIQTKQVDECQNFDNLILYDTSVEFYKVLCCSKKITNEYKCLVVIAQVEHYYWEDSITKDLQLKNLNTAYTVSLSQIHECYFNDFYNEFLLCCGKNNAITCYRNNINNFGLINQFSINLPGLITNIIMTNKVDYIIISYNNETTTNNYLYNYYIYPPKCKDISIQINSFQTFELNLLDLFENKTNTKYYIRFHNLPSSYGIIKIGQENINSNDYKKELKPERDKLYFISNSYQVTNKFDIIFNISIEETYSSICKIALTINECYHSCQGCYYNIYESSQTNHNCIKCKNSYFPYSEQINNNCYNEQEMKDNFDHWYFNDSKNIFEKCHSVCKSCYGANNDNCLSCMDEKLYAYQGKCISDCPIGTFPYFDGSGYKICKECYPNCVDCTEFGDSTNMKCSSCSEDKIKYKQNCLIIHDNGIKSFYNPENKNEIVSCYEKYNKFIKENTYECIEKPDEGYYVSNTVTGLLSPCHYSCKTCSNKIIDDNSNCIECANDYYPIYEDILKNCYSNESISIGYFLDKETIPLYWKKCYENCEECYGLGNSTNMFCLSCKKNISDFYILKLTKDNNCIKECNDKLFYSPFDECVETCPNGTYEYILNYTCLENCPITVIIYNNSFYLI